MYRRAESKEATFWGNPYVRRQVAKVLYTDPESIDWERQPSHDFAVNGESYEAKLRWPPHHEDVLIETHHSDGEAGWIEHSTADRLLYAWVRKNQTIAMFRIYDLKAIQRDWNTLQRKASGEIRSHKNVGRFTVNKIFRLRELRRYEVA
jgi:hypothetical protein